MTETLRQTVLTGAPEQEQEPIPPEIYEAILGRIATQPGVHTIDEQTLTTAIRTGLRYGGTLINGYKPDQNIVEAMARDICGLNSKPPRSIGDEPFLLVTTALDHAARIAKARRGYDYHE